MSLPINADPAELAKFSELAHRWWDPGSEFAPLHAINPLRLGWIARHVTLEGKAVLDIGCGGGILTESLARSGAEACGIDMAERPLSVARLHALESGVKVDYRLCSAEDLAAQAPESFDVVTCMEMLEHVPEPGSVIKACARLLKPGGSLFLSTINRTPRAYLLAVIGAEYILRWLPRGTHDFEKFIKPAELAAFARQAELDPQELIGMSYHPLRREYTLGPDVGVNYLMRLSKPL